MRNFGVSRRPALGADMQGGALFARDGGARESFIPEFAAAVFFAAVASVPVFSVWFLSKLIDWEGVGETFVRLCNFG